MEYTLYDNDEFIKKSENVQELLDILAERCLDNGHELNSHRLIDEGGNEISLGSVIIAAGINEVAQAGTSAKLTLIAAIYNGYYNTDQPTADFAEEFFFAIGNILKGTKKEDLNLKHLIIEEIIVPDNPEKLISTTMKFDTITIITPRQGTRPVQGARGMPLFHLFILIPCKHNTCPAKRVC